MEYFAYSQREFIYKYVVMLSDIDQFKHMSFANYLKLMFLASDAMFVASSSNGFLTHSRIKSQESRMQLKKQTTSGDQLLIKINSAQVSDDHFVLLYTYVVEKTGDLVSLGRQQYEVCDPTTGQSVTMPHEVKESLLKIQVEESGLLYRY